MTNTEPDTDDTEQQHPPRVADLRSAFGNTDPNRYHNPPYPTAWGYQ
ncbi:hypothetical protein H7J07_16715 [Mycobacterium koreense]|nr:hypothetical protein [Mycolicibacillus koreensis]MCV7249845.1 hypothetical protein [Mycolicibacillus koreensis]BBY52941.1 hypothetical protein MKOR_01920 [Mycolicibacillus koreensis]